MEGKRNDLEVTNIIPTVLLTKLHIRDVGQSRLTDLLPSLKLIAIDWRLKLNRASDLRIAIKILEESVHKN